MMFARRAPRPTLRLAHRHGKEPRASALAGCSATTSPPCRPASAHSAAQPPHASGDVLRARGRGELRVGANATRCARATSSPVPRRPRTRPPDRQHRRHGLKYLAVSTMQMPRWSVSGLRQARLSRQTQPDGTPRMVRHIARPGDAVDYWDGAVISRRANGAARSTPRIAPSAERPQRQHLDQPRRRRGAITRLDAAAPAAVVLIGRGTRVVHRSRGSSARPQRRSGRRSHSL